MKIQRIIGGVLQSNGYIIYDREGGSGYIIDPGYHYKRFVKAVEEKGLTIKAILLTHHHYDHVGAVKPLMNYWNCPAYIHSMDSEYAKFPVEYVEEQSLKVGDESIAVIHTPGHTRGGVCYYSEKSGIAFTGDTVFNVDLGRTDLEDGDSKAMEESVKKVVGLWDNGITIFPGHGDSATMKEVKVRNNELMEIIKQG